MDRMTAWTSRFSLPAIPTMSPAVPVTLFLQPDAGNSTTSENLDRAA
jgi:hypothetical protein